MADRSLIACGAPDEPHREYRYILLSEAVAYLTEGWAVKPFGGHRIGYAMAVRPYDPEN